MTRKGKRKEFTEIEDRKAEKQDSTITSECWKDAGPAWECEGGRERER